VAAFPRRNVAVAYTFFMSEKRHPHPRPVTDPGTLGAELREAAAVFLPGFEVHAAVLDAPHLLRVKTPDGDRLIRCWESTATQAGIEFTATALDRAKAAGVDLVPVLMTAPGQETRHSILLHSRLFTAATWLGGRPFARYGGYRTPSGETIDIPMPQATPVEAISLEAARALGRFHVAAKEIAAKPGTPSYTVSDFLAATRRKWANDRRILGDRAAESTEIRRWLRCGNRVMAVGGERLEAATSVLNDKSTVIHGDLWPTHLLVSSDVAAPELVGIAGWSHVSTGSPLIDIANLAVHIRGWSAENAENLVAAYHSVAPLTPEQRRTLPVIAALDLVGRVANLLHLAFLDETMIGHESTPVLRGAVRTMLPSLETLTHVLSPPEPKKYQPARSGSGSRGESADGNPAATGSAKTPTRSRQTESATRSRPEKRRGKPKRR